MQKNIVFSESDIRILESSIYINKFSNVFFVFDSNDKNISLDEVTKFFISKKQPFLSVDYNIFLQVANTLTKKKRKEIIIIKTNIKNDYNTNDCNTLDKLVKIKSITNKSLYFAYQLLSKGYFDCFIGGASEKSSTIIRDAIKKIGVQKNVKRISSAFLMLPKFNFTHTKLTKLSKKDLVEVNKNLLFFSDCAVQIDPDENELAEIGLLTSLNASKVIKSNVAFLSYSSKGSSKGESVLKVSQATKIFSKLFKKNKLKLNFDGELQADAALVQSLRKFKGSKMKNNANVFIFPNLDSANISYKFVEHLAHYYALGPILQGLNKCVCDLSRGVKTEEIIILAKYLSLYDFN